MDEAPFQPRLRPAAFLRRLLQGRPGATSGGLLVLAALGATLFCFHRVFVALGSVEPAGAPGAGQQQVMAMGGSAVLWFVLGSGFAGLLALAMHRTVVREPLFQSGGLRAMGREWRRALARWRGREDAFGEIEKSEGAGDDPAPAEGIQGSQRQSRHQ